MGEFGNLNESLVMEGAHFSNQGKEEEGNSDDDDTIEEPSFSTHGERDLPWESEEEADFENKLTQQKKWQKVQCLMLFHETPYNERYQIL